VHATKAIGALGAAGVLLLAGCGGSSGSSAAANGQDAAAIGGDSSTGRSGSAGGGRDPASVDVCSLLSQEDAAAVARDHSLNGSQTDTTVYKLTATPQPKIDTPPTSGCEFTISSDGAQGTVVIQVQSADDFGLYSSGTKVPGVGDEAYRGQGTTVVRVGSLMLSAGEDSFTDSFVTDLYRKMAPHLR
jgi:hypothetical protein